MDHPHTPVVGVGILDEFPFVEPEEPVGRLQVTAGTRTEPREADGHTAADGLAGSKADFPLIHRTGSEPSGCQAQVWAPWW